MRRGAEVTAGLWGADPDAMARLQRTLDAAAERLAGIGGGATAAVIALDQIWRGPGSGAYSATWRSVHHPRLRAATDQLRRAAATVGANSAQQESTSAADGDTNRGVTPEPTPPVGDRPTLDHILTNYQVADDEMVEWGPNLGPLPIGIPFVGKTQMTRREAELLDDLASRRGLLGLDRFRDIANRPPDDGLAFGTANEYYPLFDAQGAEIRGAEDGHNDAFRHAYLNALLTRSFGEDFARDWATAHEGVPGNPADKEAMDLYNNEVGRAIAVAHPDASDEELAELVDAAVRDGRVVVIDGAGELRYSDQVPVGQTGSANDPPAEGRNVPGDGPGST